MRPLLRWWLRHCLECLRSERAQYVAAGAAGPIYLRNCDEQERDLRSRLAMLEIES